MKNNDLYNVLLYQVHTNTFALLQHNLSARDAEEQVNELHEQKLPAFRGRQTGEHAGPVEDCSRCQRAATMMIGSQRAEYARQMEMEQNKEEFDSTGAGYLSRLRLALMALPVQQIQVVPCRRCGEMVERDNRHREKRQRTDGDLCPACVVTRFLLSSPDLTVCLRATMAQQGRHILLQRDFQKVLGAFFLAAEDSGFPLDDVDWRKVRDGWDLA